MKDQSHDASSTKASRSSANGLCNVLASDQDAESQFSSSPSSVWITGMAVGWMDVTTPFSSGNDFFTMPYVFLRFREHRSVTP
jgi:hypothetical protein